MTRTISVHIGRLERDDMVWRRLSVVATVLAGCALILGGCGRSAASDQTGRQVVVQESGAIELGDTRDPNHTDLPYDACTFDAKGLDRVRVEVVTEDFSPLLKLVEAATGAPLWEWDAEYSDQDALIYTVARPGTYEARVYAIDGSTGDYQITVILND